MFFNQPWPDPYAFKRRTMFRPRYEISPIRTTPMNPEPNRNYPMERAWDAIQSVNRRVAILEGRNKDFYYYIQNDDAKSDESLNDDDKRDPEMIKQNKNQLNTVEKQVDENAHVRNNSADKDSKNAQKSAECKREDPLNGVSMYMLFLQSQCEYIARMDKLYPKGHPLHPNQPVPRKQTGIKFVPKKTAKKGQTRVTRKTTTSKKKHTWQ